MALFVVLAALVALLAVPVWRGLRPAPTEDVTGTSATNAHPNSARNPASARAVMLSQRAGLLLATTALVLSLALILTQSLRPAPEPRADVDSIRTRTEVGALAKLAQSSMAQGEELSRERDVRRLAEEDARYRQELLAQSLDEKIRLGHDLHDGIIQSIYAAGLTLESVRALVKSNPDEAERRLDSTRISLNNAIREVRAYISGLAPENLRRAGFVHALNALLEELRAGRDVRFELKIEDDATALLTPEQTIESLQIAREAVSNALRHGRATLVTLRMIKSDQELCFLVQDNGAGFDPGHERDGGHGLGNMQVRAARLGASLKITSAPGEGTRVLATLPVIQPVTT
jgi:signal transduction histidine kinase